MMTFKEKRERFEAKHPEQTKKYKAKRQHAYWIGRTHGMTLASYNALLKAHRSRCAVCQRTAEEARVTHLSVDHCHETGRTREPALLAL